MSSDDETAVRRHFPRRHREQGSLHTIRDVACFTLGNRRDLYVYLPPHYDEADARYPVVYLQDGQNLFEPERSFAGAWGADDAADAASRLGYDAILVGVPNTGGQRLDEYSPFHDGRIGGGGRADEYLQFLVDVVKPLVDGQFRTKADRRHTIIGGSSMGGLLALYGYFRHGDTFGRASVQSPALWFGEGAIFEYVAEAPKPAGRIYLDVGAREGETTLANARRMHEMLQQKGYVTNRTLRWVEDRNGQHHEFAWGRRLRKALPFLLDDDWEPTS